MKVYVVTAPESIRGIYDTWEDCKTTVSGVPGARHMAVTTREKAQAILDGDGVPLPTGSYAFTDGNAAGGVGIVLVHQVSKTKVSAQGISLSVREVFSGSGVTGLESAKAVGIALGDLRNILAEMASLYHVLRHAEPGSTFTVVHDYKGVAEWTEGRWKAGSPVIRAVVDACRAFIQDGGLHVTFQHQKGHMSTFAGREDFAFWNARADALATDGAQAGT